VSTIYLPGTKEHRYPSCVRMHTRTYAHQPPHTHTHTHTGTSCNGTL